METGPKARYQEEGGHWYDREGAPAYTTLSKQGVERPTTLADARKEGLVPSVTTILNVLSKPALEIWKVKQGILCALTLPRMAGESDDNFLGRVLEDSKRQAIEAAAEGSRIHDAIEQYFKGSYVPNKYRPHVDSVIEELGQMFPGVDDWQAEDSFCHPLGYGGKVDLHSPSTGIVTDFKTKDGLPDTWGRLHYDQNIQLAAYQFGLELPSIECANIFVSRDPAGGAKGHIWKLKEIEHGWETFEAALRLWKITKKYDAAFDLGLER
jgi:hypothetical protein